MVDKAPITGVHKTRDGYLVADARAGRTGIQVYAGFEVGLKDTATVRVYRPEDEVFKKEALASFTSLPLTIGHPPEMVDAKNWKKYAVGYTETEVARDGEFVRVPLIVKDQAAVDAIEAGGARELSFGYICDLAFTPGKTPSGEEYDAVQRNLRGNHLAIVSAGRAGSECKIGDTGNSDNGVGDTPMPGENLKTVLVDGIPVPATDAAATVIETLQRRCADHVGANLKLTADHTAALAAKDVVIAAKDAELGKKDAEIADLKTKIPDQVALDKMVQERADVLSTVQKLGVTLDAKGKSIPEIRRAVVSAKMGDAVVQGRGDEYVQAYFDQLAVQTASVPGAAPLGFDPIRATLQGGLVNQDAANSPAAAHQAMVDRMQGAWKGTLPSANVGAR